MAFEGLDRCRRTMINYIGLSLGFVETNASEDADSPAPSDTSNWNSDKIESAT